MRKTKAKGILQRAVADLRAAAPLHLRKDKSRPMTQEEFASHLKVSLPTVGKWESTKRPGAEYLEVLIKKATAWNQPELASVFREALVVHLGSHERKSGFTYEQMCYLTVVQWLLRNEGHPKFDHEFEDLRSIISKMAEWLLKSLSDPTAPAVFGAEKAELIRQCLAVMQVVPHRVKHLPAGRPGKEG